MVSPILYQLRTCYQSLIKNPRKIVCQVITCKCQFSGCLAIRRKPNSIILLTYLFVFADVLIFPSDHVVSDVDLALSYALAEFVHLACLVV